MKKASVLRCACKLYQVLQLAGSDTLHGRGVVRFWSHKWLQSLAVVELELQNSSFVHLTFGVSSSVTRATRSSDHEISQLNTFDEQKCRVSVLLRYPYCDEVDDYIHGASVAFQSMLQSNSQNANANICRMGVVR
jgi:hypothetical protein